MADNTQRLIRELFDAASDIPASERQRWVEARAEGNPEVISGVMRLLRASSASGQGFLAEPAWKRHKPPLQEGMMIGPYRVLRELGVGGMGAVYLAMRSDEVYRRLAAVKVLHPHLCTGEALERFLQERDILARLDHSNIARIVDGGSTPEGLPYIVMDYVDGLPIDDYCRGRGASLEERLALFRQACDAVQYLHDNHVLHRDLKPANILVNHNGQVKLLDFGISKQSGEFARDETIGPPVATPAYASPEQITSKKVTGSTDIYSLGVVLYELLSGVRPLKLDNLALPELLSTITTQIPLKPSTQVALPEGADPGRLLTAMRPRLAGDLDSILLMALRKEPERRYLSAADFAADVDRFRHRRPVVARGDATTYIVGRTFRRHGWRIAAGALIVLALSWGGVATYWAFYFRDQAHMVIDTAVSAHGRLADYRALPVPQARSMVRADVTQLTTQLQEKTPAILKSNFAPTGLTREMVQQSLAYFEDSKPIAGNDPTTVAALGRAYLAVAETQWSPDHASLNDPAAAATTCAAALKSLTATDQLTKSPEIQQVVSQISAQLEQNPATQQVSPAGTN